MTGTAFPSVRLQRFDLGLNENKAMSQSLFTRDRQVVSLSGGTADRWQGVLETAPLDKAGAQPMMAFLATVGLYGLFNIADPQNTGVQSGATTGSVMGASQSGTSLIVDGLALTTTIIRAGEYFQVNEEYKIAVADATTDGAGVMTVNFRPALRASPADNSSVVFNAPRLLLVLTTIPPKAPDANLLHTFTLSFEESL